MRTILMLSIGAALAVACTTEPGRPDLSPPTSCAEHCDKDADCGKGAACCTDPAACGADHRCVACTKNEHCEAGACVGGSCVECASDADCRGNPNGSVCSPENTCGKCASDAQCKGNPAGGRCAPVQAVYQCVCATDADCKEPGLGTCRAEGCVCSDDTGCKTGAQKCDAVLGLCFGCADDSQCTDGKSKCFAANSVSAYCGCKSDAECDPMVDGFAHCAVDSGTCVECLKDADCEGGRVCLNPGMPNAACGCTKNEHCAGSPAGPVCNPGAGACQQCVTATDCEKQKLGSACTADGQCTCNDQSECGAAHSGPHLEWVCE